MVQQQYASLMQDKLHSAQDIAERVSAYKSNSDLV